MQDSKPLESKLLSKLTTEPIIPIFLLFCVWNTIYVEISRAKYFLGGNFRGSMHPQKFIVHKILTPLKQMAAVEATLV